MLRPIWGFRYKSVGTYFNDHSSCAGTPSCAGGQGMPRGPAGAVPNANCTESNITGGGNCYFVDSLHSNSWRLLRINNADENIAYIEYDPSYEWVTTDDMGSGLQFYELCRHHTPPTRLPTPAHACLPKPVMPCWFWPTFLVRSSQSWLAQSFALPRRARAHPPTLSLSLHRRRRDSRSVPNDQPV